MQYPLKDLTYTFLSICTSILLIIRIINMEGACYVTEVTISIKRFNNTLYISGSNKDAKYNMTGETSNYDIQEKANTHKTQCNCQFIY